MDNCIYKNICNLMNTESCKDTCMRYIEINYLLNTSGIPQNLQKPIVLYASKTDIESFTRLKHIKDSINSWVNSGFNLLIYSDQLGNGKTSWAIKLLLKYFDEVWAGNGLVERGLFIRVSEFMTKAKNFNAKDDEFEHTKKLIEDVDIVVWDDISSIKSSEFACEQLFNYIDLRLLKGKANIFTGNINEERLKNILGNQLASRIWNNSIRIELKGTDRRNGGEIID